MQPIIEVIKKSDFFNRLSDSSMQALADICLTKKLKKREILFLEGDDGHSMFFCVKGHIQIYKTTEDGREIVIKVIKPGEIFAEVILFEKSVFPAGAMALNEAVVLLLPKQQISCLLEREDFRMDFIGMLMTKQRYLTDQIKYLTSHDVDDRFRLFLQQQYGKQPKIVTNLSKKDIAAAIGATPETLSRMLSRLKNESILVWDGSVITIAQKFWQHSNGDL